MQDTLSAITEDTSSKKRGRKTVNVNYFDTREENAVKEFLIAKTSEEKNKIYNDFLKAPLDKFKPSKEKKAYSYFGTICKNYLMGQIIKDQKENNRKISYEDVSGSIEERPEMSYRIDEDHIDISVVIDDYLKELRYFIDKEDLNENEKKLGYALIDLFSNYDNIFSSADNNKFNKNIILLSLREMTNLSTKEIRNSMKRFKKLYVLIQNKMKSD